MPRAGVLMMRSRLIESCGLTRTFRYARYVLHFGALIETEAADHDVLAPVAPQRFFNLPRLRIGAIQHRHAILGILRASALSILSAIHSASFSASGASYSVIFSPSPASVHSHLPMRSVLLRDHGAGGFQDVFGRAVILLQADDHGARKIALEIQNVADVRAAPAVDRLILVAHHGDVVALARQQAHQLVLAAIGVLILVHHQEFVAAVEALPRGRRRGAASRTASSSRSSKSSAFDSRSLAW